MGVRFFVTELFSAPPVFQSFPSFRVLLPPTLLYPINYGRLGVTDNMFCIGECGEGWGSGEYLVKGRNNVRTGIKLNTCSSVPRPDGVLTEVFIVLSDQFIRRTRKFYL